MKQVLIKQNDSLGAGAIQQFNLSTENALNLTPGFNIVRAAWPIDVISGGNGVEYSVQLTLALSQSGVISQGHVVESGQISLYLWNVTNLIASFKPKETIAVAKAYELLSLNQHSPEHVTGEVLDMSPKQSVAQTKKPRKARK